MKLSSAECGIGMIKVILLEDGGGHIRGHEITILEKDFTLLETTIV